ncbi:MAG: endonuclease/exonuclease/phosphatase family protein [Pseudomonadota bacterium]|nr:endonuclease/exonuclease/phosphatase family protein [Pseudomonadota bacterium]
MPRILTYNVHRCRGTDRRLSPARIAEVIARCRPDIVALQELDVGRARTGGVDQAHAIAHRLAMDFHFHSVLQLEEELYGDAILTALPARLVKSGPLPGLRVARRLEPRGALWVAVDIGGTEVHIVNTHLSLIGRERVRQVAELLGPEWLGGIDPREPKMLIGDFNAVPRSAAYRAITRALSDAQVIQRPRRRPQRTFPARLPTLRLDHVFVSRGSLRVTGVDVPRSALARVASDHLPLAVDFEVLPDAALGRQLIGTARSSARHALGAVSTRERVG